MKSGYKVVWTDHALFELQDTLQYLEKNFSAKELQNLSRKIEHTVSLIAQNPNIFSKVESLEIHRVNILTFNTMYYRVKVDTIEIISFFLNRQSPTKRRL